MEPRNQVKYSGLSIWSLLEELPENSINLNSLGLYSELHWKHYNKILGWQEKHLQKSRSIFLKMYNSVIKSRYSTSEPTVEHNKREKNFKSAFIFLKLSSELLR